MKGTTRKAARLLAVAIAITTTSSAHAVLVIDLPNLFVNVANNKALWAIHEDLKSKETPGNVYYNTLEINKHTTNIESNTVGIKTSTNNIDITTSKVLEYNQWNYAIDASFSWIINNGGDEIIPIPKKVQEKLDGIANWKDPDAFNRKFKATTEYGSVPEGGYAQDTTNEGSKARKASNDAMIQVVSSEQEAFVAEVGALKLLEKKNQEVQGQAHQQQVANALAASEVNQLMKLRSMLLVAEASRAVEAQVAADKDARQIAVGRHLRDGLDSAVVQSVMPKSAY